MKIQWSEPASADLDNIWDFIAKDSEYFASDFILKLIEAVEKVSEYPKLGRVVPEFNNEIIREIIFKDYRIIYKIKDDVVFIAAVIHGSRDLTLKKNHPWNIS